MAKALLFSTPADTSRSRGRDSPLRSGEKSARTRPLGLIQQQITHHRGNHNASFTETTRIR